METIFFASPADFGKWLEEHQNRVQELWVGIFKTNTAQTGISYPEAVDQALCYGWVDGNRKKVDGNSYAIRFSPRKANSIWRSTDIKRVGELIELGLMQPSGLKAFDARDQRKLKQYAHEDNTREMGEVYLQEFRAHPKAWDFFQSQTADYQRAATWWVMSAMQEKVKMERLTRLIEESQQGQKLPMYVYIPAKGKS